MLGLHDPKREEQHIIEGIAKGKSPEELIPDEPLDVMGIFLEEIPAPRTEEDPRRDLLSLYPDDMVFARSAFDELLSADPNLHSPEHHPERPAFTLLAPEDLRRRCEHHEPSTRRVVRDRRYPADRGSHL